MQGHQNWSTCFQILKRLLKIFFEVCWVLVDLFDGRTLPITSPALLHDQILFELLRSGYLQQHLLNSASVEVSGFRLQ